MGILVSGELAVQRSSYRRGYLVTRTAVAFLVTFLVAFLVVFLYRGNSPCNVGAAGSSEAKLRGHWKPDNLNLVEVSIAIDAT